jgi:hypothetical protein
MNPRPSSTPSEDHSRGAALVRMGLIAREVREFRELRLI